MRIGLLLLTATVLFESPGVLARPTFPPLPYETPIGVFASRFKAVVTAQGDVIVKPVADGPDGVTLASSRGIRGYIPFKGTGNLRNGPRLRIGLYGLPASKAAISQQYTNDPTPVVQTDYRWGDIHLRLQAFAGEPEFSGFYVVGDLSGRGQDGVTPVIEVCLDNITGGRVLEESIIVDDDGQEILRVANAGETGERVRLRYTFAATDTCLGAQTAVVAANPDKSGQVKFALQLPMNSGGYGEFVTPLWRSTSEALRVTNASWQARFAGGMTIKVPDVRLQSAWDANLKQLGVFLDPQADGLRILKGLDRYRESTAYDTFQASLIFDRLGYEDVAEALLRRQLKRVRADGVFEMSDQAIPPTRSPDQWIVQGLAAFAIWKHYEITKDRRWLEESWPVMLRSVEATARALKKPSSRGTQGGIAISGFVPPSVGDGGIPYGYSLPQNYGPLAAVWVGLQMATILDAPEKEWIAATYEQFRSSLLSVMRASRVSAGDYQVLSPFPGAASEEATKHLWGTVVAVYPFSLVAPDDPLVLPTLRFLQAHKRDGLHLNLGYTSGVWPYMSAGAAHWHLRLGEFQEAFKLQLAILDHASPTWGWYEEYEDQPAKGYIDIPDVWGACELLHLTRELLLFEKDDSLLLAPAIPPAWMKAGSEVVVENAPSNLGTVSYHLAWRDRAAQASIRLDDGKKPDRISVQLLSAADKQPQISVSGATISSIRGQFVDLANTSSNIKIDAKW